MIEKNKPGKNVLDCLGLYCPVPIMRTKEEMDKLSPGEVLEVISDDLAAKEDIPRWAKGVGYKLLKYWEEDDEELHFLIEKK